VREQYTHRQPSVDRMADISLKTRQTAIKFTPEQYRLLELRAARSGTRVSVWMRSILVQAATLKPHKGYLRIRDPDGATT
jgi:hypothetical protein